MILPEPRPIERGKSAFSLIEMVTVIAILMILMTAGVKLLGGTSAHARRASADTLAAMIEQARAAAITSRCNVVLAFAKPGDLPTGDERCRVGMIKVALKDWPEQGTSAITNASLISRWRPLETGVILIGGTVAGADDDVVNALDGSELSITYGATNKSTAIKVHAIAFNARGGLLYPSGSGPVALRIAEGTYQKGTPIAYKRAGSDAISESRLKIGRVVGRPYHIDG